MEKINTLCSRDYPTEGKGEHKHLCRKCGECWRHKNDVANGSKELFDVAHSCPSCGQTETYKHFSDEERRAQEANWALSTEDDASFEAFLKRILER